MDNPINEEISQEGVLLTPNTMTPIQRDKGQSITMSFLSAIEKITQGNKVRRISWPTKTDHCLIKDGWLCIHTKGSYHQWSINDGDMEGQDWIVV